MPPPSPVRLWRRPAPPAPTGPTGALRTPLMGEPAPGGDGTKPEPVATQLATILAPAARQADGSYQVNIRLHPEDLGVVHVEMRLEAGTVNVSLHAEGDATRDTLRQNLDQLRQQLAGTGLSTGRFDVSGGPAPAPTAPPPGPPTPDPRRR